MIHFELVRYYKYCRDCYEKYFPKSLRPKFNEGLCYTCGKDCPVGTIASYTAAELPDIVYIYTMNYSYGHYSCRNIQIHMVS